jgi:hypothetical protein
MFMYSKTWMESDWELMGYPCSSGIWNKLNCFGPNGSRRAFEITEGLDTE